MNTQKIYDEYKCQICRDLTFIIKDNEAIPCKCREINIVSDIIKNSNISTEFRNKNFENYKYNRNEDTLNAFINAKEYANRFEEIRNTNNHSILFLGQVGVGKTHLSLSIANQLINKSIPVYYMSYRESITKIKQSILDTQNYNREMNRYKNAKVLLIDDLFKGSCTPSDINIMFEIVNYRYLNKLPMIISSEKHTHDLLNIDEAIGSRLIEMARGNIVELKGKHLNYRIN